MRNNQNTRDRKTQRLALSALKPNASNPRKISDEKFKKLVDSLLIFPRMLELRPAVVDGTNTVLGGNMRLRALDTIAQMTPEELAERLGHIRQYKSKKKAEKEYLQSYWASFLDKPECPVLHADDLTPEQVKEFIVKDNVAFGSWDWDELSNTWDSEDLSDWGLDVWKPETEIKPEDCGETFSLPNGEKNGTETITFILSRSQAESVRNALSHVQSEGIDEDMDGNKNKNGNALYIIIQQWEEQRK